MSLYPSTDLFSDTNLYPEHQSDSQQIFITEDISASLDITIDKSYVLDVGITPSLVATPIFNRFPIMGYIYQPTDIPGVAVQVESDLSDFYYLVDDSYTVPEVYWGPQPLSANVTNDNFDPYRLK